MRFGSFELISLTDCTFRLDGGAMFGVVPKRLWSRRASCDEHNRIPLGLRPLLIRTPAGRTVLIDAGVGDKSTDKERDIFVLDRSYALDASLAAVGLQAQDIDIVIASHLHFDHAGGFTTRVDGVAVPRFPRAKYFIRRGEWDDAMRPNDRSRASYLAENLRPLEQAGVIEFIEEDGDVLPGIRVARTGGHTMHHQIVSVDGGDRTAVFAADLIPTVAHVDPVWIMSYDLYPLDTLSYKKTFVREAVEREYVIFFEHEPQVAAGIIRDDAGKLAVEPLAVV